MVCFILWIVGIAITHWYSNRYFDVSQGENSLTNPALFGDSTGAINALFSALALAGVIIAIILQKRELELQRKELKATTEELKNQKEEFKIQNETLKKQRFENTFFQMMSLQQDIISDLFYEHKVKVNEVVYGTTSTDVINETHTKTQIKKIKGRNIFEYIYCEYEIIFERQLIKGFNFFVKKYGIDAYDNISISVYFSQYFCHLYRIIKYIDETLLIPDDEKYDYACIVRASLTQFELIFLFYNCLSNCGKKKFKPLVEKYALLKNINSDYLSIKEHIELYNQGAYKHDSNI